MDDKGFLNILRGSVRPIVTFIVITFLSVLVYKVVTDFASEQIALMFAGAFLATVSTVTGFWFASRNKKDGQ